MIAASESTNGARRNAPQLPWRIEDIDLCVIDRARVRDDETLFFLLATSSFVEIASHVYTANLARYYAGDDELLDWLRTRWEHEEIQHGRALRAYVQAVWPEFDWQTANDAFYREYSARCTLAEFEPTRGLELAARCVVETGTATYYRTIHDYTEEPVLKTITGHIKADEVRHYGHFWRFFEAYRARERPSRWRVLRAVARRVVEAFDDDGLIAFRHAFCTRYPGRTFERRHYDAFQVGSKHIIRRHFPVEMAVKMLLKPLDLPGRVQRLALPALTRGAALAFL
jgi:hypothetical protein